ncbi:hypothetical protein [Mesorhizobium sp. L-2-11]|uniref:hypothetical protein n=1 Tax=Mesorhizobium sp. L-2-11 TaxID=2744521 RepID=UPI0019266AA1|nr:hypothetical protein [Mesorhizobium sp. L-2-11]BCH18864.1 hypothetical protein MesoLjLa_57150 [Mesorhizobium sp. L-2-11]
MQKFSIDPERLATITAAADGAHAVLMNASEAEREARQKLFALKQRVARYAHQKGFAEEHQPEIEKLEAEIGRLKDKKDQLSESWHHLKQVSSRCEEYAAPRRGSSFFLPGEPGHSFPASGPGSSPQAAAAPGDANGGNRQ